MNNLMDNNFEFLDALNIVGFIAQIQNIQNDEEYIHFIKKVLSYLVNEIDKLHKENDKIIEKLDLLLEKKNEQ